MSRFPRPLLLPALLLSSVPLAAHDATSPGVEAPSSSEVVELAFPVAVTGTWSERSVHLVSDPAALAALENAARVEGARVRFPGVIVPRVDGLELVDLRLERLRIIPADAELWVDGRLAGGRDELEAGCSAWTGVVEGEPDSDVFLSFSRTGARGWISREDSIAHVVSFPADDGDWRRPQGLLIHQSDPLIAFLEPSWTCFADTSALEPSPTPRGGAHAARASVTYECRMAAETDYEYYQIFNDLQAAQDYAVALWGAVSSRYEAKVDTQIVLSYLGLYTTNNDPWTAHSGGAGAMLDEFRLTWGTNLPAGADLAHLMSGGNLGGGVAYVPGLCNPGWNFAVSGNISGQVSFPVPTSAWFTWDFMVVAHETGHNFGSWHTHDYCPPLDECAAGACTGGGVCTSGTIMSYCHGCPGGMTNILTHFHDFTANEMFVRASGCLDLAGCDLCGGCKEPYVTQISPPLVPTFHPDGQTLTLFGCNFNGVESVTVGGGAVDVDDIDVINDTILSVVVRAPLDIGSADVVAFNSAGAGNAVPLTVEAPPAPCLGVGYDPHFPIVHYANGLPLTVGGSPGDLVFLCYSSDPIPSVLPGIVSLDLGNNFASLAQFWTFTIPPQGWMARDFAVSSIPGWTTWYLQGAVFLASTGAPPLVATELREVLVLP